MGSVRAAAGHWIGPYELGERLGAGGMAEVYIARRAGPAGFQKKFAIKRILPQLATDARFVAMFCDEARICAALTHPNIVQVVDFGEHDGQLFMAMEYIEGVSCARLLRAVAARGERFPIGAALFIAHEVLRGLRFAHEARDEQGRPLGIVHRDVSPGNVMIGTAGEVKLTDFGIVLSAFVDRRTYPGELKGKMGYMSPEQVIGDELDPRSDLFTLAIVLAEMLLARPLFPGRHELDMLTRMYEADLSVLRRFGSELPPELGGMLVTALSRDKDQRFQTARDFADALRTVARAIGVSLNDSELAPWLHDLGLVRGRSGTRPAVRRPRADPAAVGPAILVRRRDGPRGARASERREQPGRYSVVDDSPRFHIRMSQNSVWGPLTLPRLLEVVATGKLRPSAAVSEGGGMFRPADEVPAVARLLGRPAYRFHEVPNTGVAWTHSVQRRQLARTLFALAARRESGLLVAEHGRRSKRIYLVDGCPEFIASSYRQELLGVRLAEAGLVEPAQIDEALVRGARDGRRLGEVLVASGLIRPMGLLRALSEQIEARFIELFGWTDGEICFVPGAHHGEQGVRLRLEPVRLVARGVHEGYDDAEVAALLEPVRRQPLGRTNRRVDARQLGLSSGQRRALELAPGASNLDALIRQMARDAAVRPEDTLRGVFLGLCSGALHTPEW